MFVETTFSLSAVLTAVLVFSDVQAGSCPHHVNKVPHSYTSVHNHVCYLFVNNELYWSKAREKCWDLGGEMLSIENQETMDFIRKRLSSPELSWDRNGVWLGASKKYGKWKWTNGRYMNYSNWAPGQPSNILGILSVEDCSQLREEDGWKWHDIPCGSLKFHYNFVCQFPAVVTTTTIATVTTDTAQSLNSTFAKFNNGRTQTKLSSEEYRRLGEEFFQILNSQGFPNSYNFLHSGSNHAALNKPGDVAGNVASSAANQSVDNGNSSILAIIIGVSTSLLLIMGIIFLVLYYRQRQSKKKASETPVHFTNNTYSRAPNGSAHRDGQVLPVPTSQVPFASNEELYLEPHSNNKPSNNRVNSVPAKECKCVHQQSVVSSSLCSSPGTDSELGACGGSDPDQEIKVPLMAANKIDSEAVGASCAACQSVHGCCSLNQGDYIAMNSQAHEKDKDIFIKEEDEKHTYSNVDHRDVGSENLYEVLP
ncbi:hypothetical protein BsWGS_06036 [Bradybaena similaris]